MLVVSMAHLSGGVSQYEQECTHVLGRGALYMYLNVCLIDPLSSICLSPIPRMAEWVKQQAEREAEKEQKRLERLQRKLAEPRHCFTSPDYQQQCHEMAERLEDSVLKGEREDSFVWSARTPEASGSRLFHTACRVQSFSVFGLQTSENLMRAVEPLPSVMNTVYL